MGDFFIKDLFELEDAIFIDRKNMYGALYRIFDFKSYYIATEWVRHVYVQYDAEETERNVFDEENQQGYTREMWLVTKGDFLLYESGFCCRGNVYERSFSAIYFKIIYLIESKWLCFMENYQPRIL